MKFNVFPFSALIGQEELKLGLLLNAINPSVGGILIRGEKGTAKSTAVRGLAELLPDIEAVQDCRFSCDPARSGDFCGDCRCRNGEFTTTRKKVQLIELPLNATEDRVAGGIDFSQAIQTGKAVLQPGLLADAHRSMLYIDEVNLLDDHIVDLVLDAASSGRNVVEREGISFSHPARIILVGTMNPEEGELRPQLLDRFGLCIEIAASQQIDERIELLIQRESYDADPEGYREKYLSETKTIRERLKHARKILPEVRLAPHMRKYISELCASKNVAGHRADLILEQAARALAAYEGKEKVANAHIAKVAPMVLLHRQRDAEEPPPPPEEEKEDQQGQEEDNSQEQEKEKQETEDQKQPPPHQPSQEMESEGNDPDDNPAENQESEQQQESGLGEDIVFDIGEPFKVKKITASKDRIARRGSGRRSRSRISQKQGRYIKATRNLKGMNSDIALDATIRAAAPFQKSRAENTTEQNGNLAVHLTSEDVRHKIREKRIGNLLLFIVDGSGSMGARGRMVASKSAIMSLLLDAYQKRDKVSMISFRRKDAQVNLPVTNSVELAGRMLAEMPVGGRTPLSAGLAKGYEIIRNYLIREPSGKPIVIILTDGKTNVSLSEMKPVDEMVHLAGSLAQEKRAKYIVVDTEDEGLIRFGLAQQLATALGGDYFKTGELQAEELVNIIREQQ